MTTRPPSSWTAEKLATHEITRVRPDLRRAIDLVAEARRRIASAELIIGTDPSFALSGCHDAVRMAIDAFAETVGYRIESPHGHHKLVIDFARHELGDVLDSDVFDSIDRLRDRRNAFDYGKKLSGALRTDEVTEHIEVARRVVAEVADVLATLTRRRRT